MGKRATIPSRILQLSPPSEVYQSLDRFFITSFLKYLESRSHAMMAVDHVMRPMRIDHSADPSAVLFERVRTSDHVHFQLIHQRGIAQPDLSTANPRQGHRLVHPFNSPRTSPRPHNRCAPARR